MGTIGIALQSGAAYGAAHAGVLLALEEAGIAVDIVTGASAGALVGGAWAAGLPAGDIAAAIRAARWADFATAAPSARLGLFDTGPMRARLTERIGAARIEDLPVAFGAVVTTMPAARPVVITSGSLVDAMAASSAVPGLFPPVVLDGRRYVDGGVASPVPVWAARRMGADRVIAVTLGSQPWWTRVHELAPRHPVDIQHADLVIAVDVTGRSAWSHLDVPELIEAGYRAAHDRLSSVRSQPSW